MQKKSLLALALALTLFLSGCTLIQKDAAVDAATEIIRYGDTVITKGEIQKQVDSQLAYMAYYYSLFGYSFDVTDPKNISDARDAVITSYKTRLVVNAKAKEMGLDQLTAEEEAKIKEDAEKEYHENKREL